MTIGVSLLAILGTLAAPDDFVPTSAYVDRTVAGWTVKVNRDLIDGEHASLGREALRLLQAKLGEIVHAVPAPTLAELRKVPIWLGVNDGHAPCAEYHPSREWLAEHGYNPDKARGVEIGNARRFLDWSRDQPSMVLHELAHAYHDQVLGYDHGGVREAYRRAVEAGAYDLVPRVGGRRERAYALTSPQEFFAEASEAFFGRNDFYPFDRDELQEHDPGTAELMGKVWRDRGVSGKVPAEGK